MSYDTATLGVMSSQTFIARTKASLSICGLASAFKSRGSNMNDIDGGLRAWERVAPGGDQAEKLTCLLGIQLASAQWLQRKRGKSSALANFRRATVQEVMVQARDAHQFLGRKAGAAKPTKSLDAVDGYHKERQHFLNQHKQHNPRGASGVTGLKAMSQPDYDALEVNDTTQVNYFRRDTRIGMLAYAESGRFYQGTKPIHCTIEDFGGIAVTSWVYAVDRHGNMFVMDFFTADRAHTADGEKTLKGYFNHSSFCAGREVMTAGTIVFLDGELKYISNLSGHYKPSLANLQNYLVLLGQEGVALDNVAAQLMTGAYRARTLVNNGAADWPTTATRFGKGSFTAVQHRGQTYRVEQPAG